MDNLPRFRKPPMGLFFVKSTLFRGKGGPSLLEEPAPHHPHQRQGIVRPNVCPTAPAISSTYEGASGDQLTDCWHQMSNCGQTGRLFITLLGPPHLLEGGIGEGAPLPAQ